MIRVTKAEVKEALGEREMTKAYCICSNCHYAFRITDEERKGYQGLRCGNCSTAYFYYAGYYVGLDDSIIDPEPKPAMEMLQEAIKQSNLSELMLPKSELDDILQTGGTNRDYFEEIQVALLNHLAKPEFNLYRYQGADIYIPLSDYLKEGE